MHCDPAVNGWWIRFHHPFTIVHDHPISRFIIHGHSRWTRLLWSMYLLMISVRYCNVFHRKSSNIDLVLPEFPKSLSFLYDANSIEDPYDRHFLIFSYLPLLSTRFVQHHSHPKPFTTPNHSIHFLHTHSLDKGPSIRRTLMRSQTHTIIPPSIEKLSRIMGVQFNITKHSKCQENFIIHLVWAQ